MSIPFFIGVVFSALVMPWFVPLSLGYWSSVGLTIVWSMGVYFAAAGIHRMLHCNDHS
jgi:hypothetical protein